MGTQDYILTKIISGCYFGEWGVCLLVLFLFLFFGLFLFFVFCFKLFMGFLLLFFVYFFVGVFAPVCSEENC